MQDHKTTSEKPPCPIRVMTFNVRGAYNQQDGLNAWPNRADLNVQTIKDHAPDLIGFQECQQGNLDIYEAQLTDYTHLAGPPVSNPDPAKHEYVAIFWRRDRFELLAAGQFWLSKTPDIWSGDWDTACVRGANWAKLQCAETGHIFLYLNTHLDHVSKLARHKSSDLILQKLTDIGGDHWPVIITGDFNANAWNPDEGQGLSSPRLDKCHQIFLAHGFKDTYLAAGNDDSKAVNTFHGFKGEAYQSADHMMSFRIDWILTRDGDRQRFQTTSCLIIQDKAPPLYPSDHYPVLAELVLGD